jgi:hypothetical protein
MRRFSMSHTGFGQSSNIEAERELKSTGDGGDIVSGGCESSMRGDGGQNEYGRGAGMRWATFFLSRFEIISR